ncbi:SDR family oxidoreductase [Allorhizobium undicola]|uniref:SDR family oxidoreductase n=1 Tax=Allorhizobium undicola TaxID=78527 RepID=UPI003D331869
MQPGFLPRHVIITGGSSGIGLALARLYALQGAAVSLIGRSPQRLAEAALLLGADSRHGCYGADVADFDALGEALKAAQERFGPCDLLVTSAGVVHPAPLERQDTAMLRRQVETNLLGTIYAAKLLWPSMKEHGGQMVFISSGAAHIGLHGYAPYCATKAALVGLADSLRQEAAGTSLRIAICFPPDTDTPQLEAELPLRSPEAERLMGKVQPWTADDVATQIYQGLRRNRHEIHFGLTLWALARFGSLVRPLIYRWFKAF